MFILENEFLKIGANSNGGELNSIYSKKTGNEYLWNASAEHWNYSAPTLFPIIGMVKNGKYLVENKSYELPKHGFARVSQFEMIEQSEAYMTFNLKYNNELLKMYPYKFELNITYRINGTKVFTEYSVKNIDEGEIYFSIGGHPALSCPMAEGYDFEDYYFEFEKEEKIDRLMLNEQGYFVHETTPCLDNEKIIPLSYDLFKDDAIMFYNTESKNISLKSKKHKEYIKFDYEGFPYLGLWTKKNAPFVCVEPWCGHTDYADFSGDFSQKEGNVKLSKGQIFNVKYSVEICE